MLGEDALAYAYHRSPGPHLLTEAKKYAAESGCTLTAVLEQALREALARRSTKEVVRPLRLKTCKGSGLRAGVDLDDSAALLDLMGK